MNRADGTFAGLLRIGDSTLPSIAYVELPGAEVHAPNMTQAEAFGVVLRKLHDSALTPRAKVLPTVEPLKNINRRLSEAAKWLPAAQARELAFVVEEAEKRVRDASLPPSVCHGDVRYANVRFEGEQPSLFDLEALGLGPAPR